MTPVGDLSKIPEDVAIPVDDGACEHLTGMRLPSVLLASTDGGPTDVASIAGRVVIYCYPRTGTPDRTALVPEWDQIPGARGCTPQNSAFRDRYEELRELGVTLFGLSSQDTAYQREMAERLKLPYAVLSDSALAFASALQLPTFTAANVTLIKRLTIVANDGIIQKVFYPVFPPGRDAGDVVDWFSGKES